MSIFNGIQRLREYQRRHGLVATLERATLAMRRALLSSHSVLFYCDLAGQVKASAGLPASLQVERKKSLSELGSDDLQDILNAWNASAAERNMKERFAMGASLWLIKSGGKLAGYGWTLQGRTVEPHYFPLAPDDVQFLDFYIFQRYRGKAIDWFLMTYILRRLAAEGLARAFGEAAEWNQASLSSFRITPFRFLGRARKVTILGRTVVSWAESNLRPRTPAANEAPLRSAS
ncbi:MAG TPA: GNAT family N-acetyltransferase [Candidatus Eisenbacteria bacterium]|nr:GNAT family N-acetyltransferase [Candidatus Eisenbacteria bacterium]